MDPATAAMLAPFLGQMLGGLFGGDGGNSKAANRALAAQARLANTMANVYGQQASMDLPYRQDLFSALRQRAMQATPRFMPGRMPTSNPYANVQRYRSQRPYGGGSPTLSNALRLTMMQRPSYLNMPNNSAAANVVGGVRPTVQGSPSVGVQQPFLPGL